VRVRQFDGGSLAINLLTSTMWTERWPRSLVLGTMLLVLLGAICTVVALPSGSDGIHRADRMEFGVLGSECDPGRVTALRTAGVELAQVDVGWDRLEPLPEHFDSSYASELKTKIQNCRNAGLQVVLGLGLSYAPDWVSSLPNGKYLDQRGQSSPGSVPNIVFSEEVRSAFARYVARLADLIGLDGITAIRVGTSEAGELGYPVAGDTSNSYWAFGDSAQTGHGLPPGVERSPLPQWSPGSKTWNGVTVHAADVAEWFNWYSQSLAEAVIWQIGLVRSLGFQGTIHVLFAGKGVLPADLKSAIAARLDGTADRDDGLETGLYYPHQMRYIASAFPGGLVVADVTGLDDASAVDARKVTPRQDSCQPTDLYRDLMTTPDVGQWSASRWTIANARQAGLDVVGENPGPPNSPGTGGNSRSDDLRAQMTYATQYAIECGLAELFWAFETDLFDPTEQVTLTDYANVIKRTQQR